jgi:hypothetical protein
MNTLGNGTSGETELVFDSDQRITSPAHTITEELSFIKLSAYLSGLNSGSDQMVRGAIYADGIITAGSETLTIEGGTAPQWHDFDFGGVVRTIPAGTELRFALFSGPGDSVIVYGDDDDGGDLAADTWSDGWEIAFTPTADAITPSLFATYFQPWTPRVLPDAQLARLGFPSAQEALGSHGGSLAAYTATCGWYGFPFDPDTGSFGIVRTDGPLHDLIGERVRITYGDLSAVVYVKDRREVVEDIAVTRRVYMHLTTAATTELTVEVEVLA